jgi:hypothetical protein
MIINEVQHIEKKKKKKKNLLMANIHLHRIINHKLMANLHLLSFVIGTICKQFIFLRGDLANLGQGFPKRSLVDVTRPFLAKLRHQKQRENIFFGCTQESISLYGIPSLARLPSD